MFKNLSDRLTGIFDKLKSRGSLTESDVDLALREVRVALLEADVALEVVKQFLEKAKKKAVGSKIVKSVSPSQMVIKIVNDTLQEILGKNWEKNFCIYFCSWINSVKAFLLQPSRFYKIFYPLDL